MASGKLQILCYKEEIEALLRTRGLGGFQVLQANDFPGQGTALVGWLNPFWESKGYVTPEEFRRFNTNTVPLARLPQRLFTTEDTLQADLEVAHFGPAPLEQTRPWWKLVDAAGRVHAEGELPAQTLPVGNGISLGRVSVPLDDLPAPGRYTLIAGLAETEFANDWDVWVYPPAPRISLPEEITIVRTEAELLRQAHSKKKILYLPEPGPAETRVALGFSSIFWNTAWTKKQAPHTLGILCDPGHPFFAEFPTEFHSNWQWWELIHGAMALALDGLPAEVRPLVQVIDDWFTNRRLGLVFEARLNDCDLLVCGSDIDTDLDLRHAARQFRHSLLAYMSGPFFRPCHTVTAEQLPTLRHPGC